LELIIFLNLTGFGNLLGQEIYCTIYIVGYLEIYVVIAVSFLNLTGFGNLLGKEIYCNI
jgi:hypothetical protein